MLLLTLTPFFGAFSQTFSGIGNTWLGGTYTDKRGNSQSRHVQGKIVDGFVTSGGDLFAVTNYEEAHLAVARYWDNGDGRGMVEMVGPRHWATGEASVAVNGSYVYVNTYDGGNGENRVQSYNLSNYSNANNVLVMTSPATGSTKDTRIFGLAWSTVNNELYVADNYNGKIKVYNATLGYLREFTFARPRKIAVAGDGNLWIIQGGTANETLANPGSGAKAVKVNRSNGAVLDEITDVSFPTAIAVSHSNGNLLIADSHPDRNNIRIYNASNGDYISTFGKSVSNGTTPGDWSDATQFDYLTAIGQTSNGDYVVACKGSILFRDYDNDQSGVFIRRITSAGAKVWEAVSNTFIDCADLDPGDNNVAYTTDKRFSIDWSKGPGQEWTVKGYTISREQYPNDPRINNGLLTFSQVSRVGGRSFPIVTNQWNDFYCFYRKGSGEILVPSVIISRGNPLPNAPSGNYLWVDGSGGQAFDGNMQSGEYVSLASPGAITWVHADKDGHLWVAYDNIDNHLATQQKLRRYRCGGLNANNIPIYSATDYTEYTCPDFNHVNHVQYDKDNDILYVSGFYSGDTGPNVGWRTAGLHLKRYNNFLASNTTAFNESSTINFPNENADNKAIVNWSVSTPYLFVGQRAFSPIFVYNTDGAGSYVTKWDMPSSVGGIDRTWYPGTGFDTPHGMRSVKRSNGEYVIFAEDVSFGKVFMHRWCPTGTCTDPVSGNDSTDPLTGTISARGENGTNESAAKAFDNSSSSKWLNFINGSGINGALPSWIQYVYASGEKYTVTAYTLTSANDAPERDPKDFKLYGVKDDNSLQLLDTRTNINFSARYQKQTFSITNSTAYKGYRLEITAVRNAPSTANSVQLAEIELLGTKATTTTSTTTRYEAENGSIGNGATSYPTPGASNGSVVGDLHNSGAYLQWGSVNGGSGGTATLRVRYATAEASPKISLYVNGTDVQQLTFSSTGSWESFTTLTTTISLSAGTGNTIKLQDNPGEGDGGGVDIDYIELVTTSSARLGVPVPAEESLVMQLSPNPAHEQVLVTLVARQAQNTVLGLYNTQGQQVSEYHQQLQAGENRIAIPVRPLRPGMYLIQTVLDGQRLTRKLLVE